MTVYVDDAAIPYRRGMVMCHMAADTTEELTDMAARIGLRISWLQDEGTYREHFDVSLTKRRMAVSEGAVEVTRRELVEIMREKL